MPQFVYSAGFNNVGSYQASAEPWCSASLVCPALGNAPTEVTFPQVTKFVVIKNDGVGDIRVGFSAIGTSASVGAQNNYFTLAETGSFAADFRVTGLYLLSDSDQAGTATVVAGLTGIRSGHLADNWSGSAGVG
jgi:hypothetical protein